MVLYPDSYSDELKVRKRVEDSVTSVVILPLVSPRGRL
jgi:hypothetical protein